MDIFQNIVASFISIPAWISLILLPALFLGYTIATALFGGRSSYFYIAGTCCALEAIFVSAHGAPAAICACGLFAMFAIILRLLYRIPSIKSRTERKQVRSERILKRLEEARVPEAAASKAGAKVCAFAAPVRYASAEDYGMRLTHAEELLGKLHRTQLSAQDRLEVEILTRTVHGYEMRLITEEELAGLNDSLVSVLKLSAKYKL